jgi:DME family drug/metabolite transporter
MPARSSHYSFLLLVLAGLLWGTGGVTGHALADTSGLSAPAIAGYRLGLGGLLLVVLLSLQRIRPRRGTWPAILVTAALASVFQSAYFGAVALGTVSTATLITIGSAPIFVVLLQAIRHRRRPGLLEIRPVLLGVIGLGLLVGSPAAGSSLGASLAGAGLAALSGAAFAVFTLFGRRAGAVADQQAVTGYGFLIGGCVIALIIVPFQRLTFPASASSIGLLVLFATVPTALAYTLFFRGLRDASAATATVVALLEPLTGTVLAVIIFGDRLSWSGVVGAALLLLSVLDAGRGQLRSQPALPERRRIVST